MRSNFFQSETINNSNVLLTYVLQGKPKEAKELYTKNPELLFIKATAEEHAAGIDENDNAIHRIISMSPLKAMAACGDGWMLQDALAFLEESNYVDSEKNESGLLLAYKQLTQQFPEGFLYPASDYCFEPLYHAIDNDEQLRDSDKPNETTKALLAQFKKDFIPDTVIKPGYIFNLNHLIDPLYFYARKWNSWSLNTRAFFWTQVIGYLERLVTTVDAHMISTGSLYKDFSKGFSDTPITRDAKIDHFATDHSHREILQNNYLIPDKKLSYFPLDEDKEQRLGVHFAIDPCYPNAKEAAYGLPANISYYRMKEYMELKQRELPLIMSNLERLCHLSEKTKISSI